jgi:hypothetical protein
MSNVSKRGRYFEERRWSIAALLIYAFGWRASIDSRNSGDIRRGETLVNSGRRWIRVNLMISGESDVQVNNRSIVE